VNTPENHNVKCLNERAAHFEVWRGNSWIKENGLEMVKCMSEIALCYGWEKIEEGEIFKGEKNKWERVTELGEDEKNAKKHLSTIKLALYNNKSNVEERRLKNLTG
jgi:hypothetical protein